MLSGTMTVNETLANPVTRAKLRDLVRTAAVQISGTVPASMIENGAVNEAKINTELLAELRGIFDDAVAASCPVGKIDMFCDSTLPAGWVLCDGSNYNNDDYPQVAARKTAGTDPFEKFTDETVYEAGVFTVPDYRGYFPRAWDGNASLEDATEESVGPHRHRILAGRSSPYGECSTLTGSDSEGVGCPSRRTAAEAEAGSMVAKTGLGDRAIDEGYVVEVDDEDNETDVNLTENAPKHYQIVFAVYIGEQAEEES